MGGCTGLSTQRDVAVEACLGLRAYMSLAVDEELMLIMPWKPCCSQSIPSVSVRSTMDLEWC